MMRGALSLAAKGGSASFFERESADQSYTSVRKRTTKGRPDDRRGVANKGTPGKRVARLPG